MSALRLILAAISAGLLIAAQRPAAAHAECARHFQAAQPIPALAVEAPPEARRLGLSGDVVVALGIDVDGKLREAVVAAWSDPMFIQPARDAAMSARYIPMIVECVARPTIVAFSLHIAVAPVPERVDVGRFFPGTWKCTLSRTERWRTIKGGLERETETFKDQFIRQSDASWMLVRDGKPLARAHPWVDERWTFISGDSGKQHFDRYIMTGVDSFYRITAEPRDTAESRCTRAEAR